jgi:two-component system phosphate regulon sensor histidine kinase PhoR
MTVRFAWVSMVVAGGTALAVLLAALTFLPPSMWESFVPIATVIGGAGVLAAGAAAAWTGERMARPLRRMVGAVEADGIGRDALREFARDAPSEVAGLLYALQHAHARLHRTLGELERDRAQMATVLEHMGDGVLVLDPDERIELANPAGVRLLRAPPPVGRTLAEVARDAELVEVARAARAAEPVSHVVELRSGSGTPRLWVQVSATRLPDGRRTLVLLQDVTDLRRAEAARRDLVANVSHELRTPVAALKALVETLEAGALDDPEAGPDFLCRMHIEVDGLAELVAELLELARAEAGRLELDLVPCQPAELLSDAVERTRPYAERVGLQVNLANPPERPILVQADARRIGQVLTNLLANAVKFCPPGGRIEAGARAVDGWVEFWIADTGVGIEADQLVRVFERFYKTDPSRTGAGTGLGLAICKHYIQAHGGSIWAESGGEGQGATFRFTLRQLGTNVEAGPLPPPSLSHVAPAVEPGTDGRQRSSAGRTALAR